MSAAKHDLEWEAIRRDRGVPMLRAVAPSGDVLWIACNWGLGGSYYSHDCRLYDTLEQAKAAAARRSEGDT